MSRMDSAVRAASSVAGLLKRRNVVGVGAGFKVVGGKTTDIAAVIIFVEKKMEPVALRKADLVPSKWKGVPTDVIETGPFRAYDVNRRARIRPAVPGVSIGHYQITAGTLGAVVVDRTDGRPLILSNNHVLANTTSGSDGRAFLGDPIMQPGPSDGGRGDRDIIAHLLKVIPLGAAARPRALSIPHLTVLGHVARLLKVFNLPEPPSVLNQNHIDAALARPVNDKAVRPDILGIGPVSGVTEPRVGLRVQKSGRTSGVTTAKIVAVNASVNVEYPTGVLSFTDQLVMTHLGDPGDSGSLVVDEKYRAVGLFFAGSETTSLANPIGRVLDALGVEFPSTAQAGRAGA